MVSNAAYPTIFVALSIMLYMEVSPEIYVKYFIAKIFYHDHVKFPQKIKIVKYIFSCCDRSMCLIRDLNHS